MKISFLMLIKKLIILSLWYKSHYSTGNSANKAASGSSGTAIASCDESHVPAK